MSRINRAVRRLIVVVGIVPLMTITMLAPRVDPGRGVSSPGVVPTGTQLTASVNPAPAGYYLAGQDGATYAFGAPTYGSTYTYGLTGLTGSHPLNAPIVAIIATPDGKGYWLIAKDGGVFDFGDAHFYGSTYTYGLTGLTGSHPLNAPIVGMAAAPNGGGYWLVAADGGVFDFGDAPFEGSLGGQTISGRIVAIAAAPNPTPVITTTALPGAIVGQPYSSSVAVESSETTTALTASGLPTGLTLTQSGTIQGTPTTPGLSRITLTATAPNGASSTRSFDLVVTQPLQGAVAAPTPQASSNWSGYYVEPGSFDAITGTFTVPGLSANQPSYCASVQGTPSCSLSEWVGVDGANNSSLIQAGVELTPEGNGSTYQIYPWWEILPNVQTDVTTLTISAGDQVTVSIFRATNTNNWEIQIVDDTTGRGFTTTQPYNGPGTSAEWIVEAPSTTSQTILEVPIMSSPIRFSSLGVNTISGGSISSEIQSFLCQVTPEQPGLVSNNGFQVTQLTSTPTTGPCASSLLNSTAHRGTTVVP
ncbi:G1 family glutamic endopeptidase [Ferrimicrobium sp.]|uniref:G1 family glutamic endopeptidase n=1 Tax=Ferrimicrobium sp. TaxID=2926050 RepID=UPI002607D16E|nr:G1 family glutamic endopeptidase [Ferrimicrobium sp.]